MKWKMGVWTWRNGGTKDDNDSHNDQHGYTLYSIDAIANGFSNHGVTLESRTLG